MRKLTFTLLFFALVQTRASAQTAENTGWFFISNTHKLSEKIDFLTDVQLRTADRFNYVGTLLLRAASNYNFNKQNSIALGYAYKGDWEHEVGEHTYSPENRIYEQYLYTFKMGRTEFSTRVRLEQRFIREDGRSDFSQRARAFVSAQIPLVTDTAFSRGLYTGIQNELFLNVQHKDKVNKNLFDQNRSFLSLGYRFSKKIDAEFGYMYWYQKELEGSARTNVWQLMLTTRF